MQQKEKKVISKYEKNLRWIFLETILTSVGAGFSISTINDFWNSIGMNQTQIGLVQMMFTIVILALDIPMGYVADRFDRKKLNIIGDIGVAVTFLYYAFSKNVVVVGICESLLGIFMAMTNGVDQAFMKHSADKIDPTGNYFKKLNARIYTWRYISSFVVILLGGLIARYSLALTIALSFIPYFIGGLCAFKIEDVGEKSEVNHKNPFKDLLSNGKKVLSNRETRVHVLLAIVTREITHSQIWMMTPLFKAMGYPIEIAALGWVLDSIFRVIGSKISGYCVNWKSTYKFAMIVTVEFSWIIALVLNCTPVTVWLFALNGFVVGLVSGTLIAPVQSSCDNKLQSTVVSIMSTGGRLLYIPLVAFINYLGNLDLQLGLFGVIVCFSPLVVICLFLIIKFEFFKEKDKLDELDNFVENV